MPDTLRESPLRSARPRLAVALLGLAFIATVVSGPIVDASLVVRDEDRSRRSR